MNKLEAVLSEGRRRAVLEVLLDQNGFTLNEGILQDALDVLGFPISRDLLRSEIQWLSEQGLVTNEPVGELWRARLGPRGHDVASGKVTVPGVSRPRP